MGPNVTDFLFAQPSFFYGLARTLDIGAAFDAYNQSATPKKADQLALASDWAVVRQDLLNAWSEVWQPDVIAEFEAITLEDPAFATEAKHFIEAAPRR